MTTAFGVLDAGGAVVGDVGDEYDVFDESFLHPAARTRNINTATCDTKIFLDIRHLLIEHE
jgi:hypothetical protein